MTNIRTAPDAARRDEGSMMLAILFAVVMTALIAAATVLAIAGQEKTQRGQTFAAGQQAVDNGLADAMSFANRGGDFDCVTSTSPRTGTFNNTKWTWYATPRSGLSNGPCGTAAGAPAYTLTLKATTTATTDTREYVADVTSLRVPKQNGVTVAGNTITYNTGDGPNMTGFFANTAAVLRGSSNVTSFNATNGTTWTGNGMVGSNGTVTLSDSASADKVVLWDFKAQPNPDRCSGTLCATAGKVQTQSIRLGVTGECAYASPHPAASCTAPTKFIDEQCKTETSFKPWIASENGTTPTLFGGNTYCVSALIFDRDTVVNASPTNPVKVYVTSGANASRYGAGNSGGAIVVMGGIKVNYTGTNPTTTTLQVYAKSNTVSIAGNGAGDTYVNWNLFAPNADCSGSEDPTGTRWVWIYGSMTCNTLTTGAKWGLRYDEQQQLVAPNPATTQVWYVSAYKPK